MELSPALQKLVFLVIVVVLGVFGYILIGPGLRHHAAAAPSPSLSPSASPSLLPVSSAPAAVATTEPAAAGGVDIYNWLPFTQQDLAAAAAVAVKVGVDYNTFSYTQTAAAWTGQMTGLITPSLAGTLAETYSMQGLAKLRNGEHQVSTGTAAVSSLRAFGPTSLTFVVTADQHIVSSAGTTNGTAQWAFTVTSSAGGWLVSDIEPAQDGNT
jgi:hypothetical protein